MQLGRGFASRQFAYHNCEITNEHKENAKVKSSPTTQLAKNIGYVSLNLVSEVTYLLLGLLAAVVVICVVFPAVIFFSKRTY